MSIAWSSPNAREAMNLIKIKVSAVQHCGNVAGSVHPLSPFGTYQEELSGQDPRRWSNNFTCVVKRSNRRKQLVARMRRRDQVVWGSPKPQSKRWQGCLSSSASHNHHPQFASEHFSIKANHPPRYETVCFPSQRLSHTTRGHPLTSASAHKSHMLIIMCCDDIIHISFLLQILMSSEWRRGGLSLGEKEGKETFLSLHRT